MPDISTLPYPTEPLSGPGFLIALELNNVLRPAEFRHVTYLDELSYGVREATRYHCGPNIHLWASGNPADGPAVIERLRAALPTTHTPQVWADFLSKTTEHGFYLLNNEGYAPAVRIGSTGRVIPDGVEGLGLVASLQHAQEWCDGVGNPVGLVPWVYNNPRLARADEVVLRTYPPELSSEQLTGFAVYMPNNNTSKVENTHPLLPANTGSRVCGRCGEVGHNVRTCANHFQLWDKMGIEVEGRFANLGEKRRMAIELTGEEGTSDGSLRNSESNNSCWEFRTRPGKLASAMNQLHALYPDETGPDCGMHIHVSFSTADIALLYNTDFFTYFRAEWKAWGEANNVHRGGEFWKRLNGENNYCRQNTSVIGSMLNMDRYHQLNFSAWESHKTVECRLLPMFRSEELALLACKKLISIYETWLAMDHSSRLPDVDIELPSPVLGTEEFNSEVETPTIKFDLESTIGVTEIPPPAPGMMRVVVPTGRIQSPSVAGNERAQGVTDFIRDLSLSLAA